MKRTTRSILLILALLFAGCSAVRIETGPSSHDPLASAEQQAKQIRARWANDLLHATPQQMAALLISHADSSSSRLLAFGADMARQWRDGNAAGDHSIPAAEIQEAAAKSTESQRPIIEAWSDNLKFGLDRIERTRFFPQEFIDRLSGFVGEYNRVYNAVFFPTADVATYENQLLIVRRDIEAASAVIRRELERY
ncbi:MAG TPA: hypothetical protein VN285_11290 [Candidatus Deferrimicrobium sp.]|nr:hypothetical protein [Candidatus Deferrimicrobium sp.]